MDFAIRALTKYRARVGYWGVVAGPLCRRVVRADLMANAFCAVETPRWANALQDCSGVARATTANTGCIDAGCWEIIGRRAALGGYDLAAGSRA